jgi:hypothetical protein
MLVWGRGVGAPASADQLREMSLFHDFKLKRRKVDSRCSTEGKSPAMQANSTKKVNRNSSYCIKCEDGRVGGKMPYLVWKV